jgi:FkbM family methyltransferase
MRGFLRRIGSAAIRIGGRGATPLFDVHEISSFLRPEGEARIRRLCQAVYLGDNEVLARCLGRYKMFLDSRDTGFAPHIMLDGYWEFWITRFVVRAVRPGMTVVDVGANFGYYSVLLADLIGDAGRLVAVEPNPHVAAKLRKTLSINGFDGRATVREVALTQAADGKIAFFMPAGQPLNSRVVPPDSACEGGETITVGATNIDALCAKLDRVDFIKVDAEGAEAGIIEGMKETIARHRPTLLLETNAARGYDIAAVHALLAKSYPSIGYLDVDSRIKPATARDLQTVHVGEDWMLVCSAGRNAE